MLFNNFSCFGTGYHHEFRLQLAGCLITSTFEIIFGNFRGATSKGNP